MSRTRLRGLEIAGIQIGIEVPQSCSWEWPDEALAEYACLPRDPEVNVGVRVGNVGSQDLAGEHYALGTWTFEIARRGEDWLLGLSRAGRREQLAVFDGDFRAGEIVLSSEAAKRPGYPLQSPLDEWIVLQRNIARGGLCLNATATAHHGRARIQLGAHEASTVNGWSKAPMPPTSMLGRNALWLREEGAELRAYRTPWGHAMDLQLGFEARVLDFDYAEESELPYRETLDPDEAADLLVTHAVVPLCDEALLERVLSNARRLAEAVPFRRVGKVRASDAPMNWQSPQLQRGFAPPRSLA